MIDDDSNMKTFTKTKFIISGFPMKPNELTRLIGIEPTTISEKGQLTQKYKLVIKENSLSIEKNF